MNEARNNEIEKYLIDIIGAKKPATTQQLVEMVNKKYSVTGKEISAILIDLENNNKLRFSQRAPINSASLTNYALSRKSLWYWMIVSLSISTTAAVYLLPGNVYQLVYIRFALGLTFVSCLPGYAFIKALRPAENLSTAKPESMGIIDKVVLSLGMSFILASLTGLILNFTPWGITLTPITICLLSLTMVLSTIAIFRENQTMPKASTKLR